MDSRNHLDSEFYDVIFSKPASNPLRNLRKINNSACLGSGVPIKSSSIMAPWKTIVKLSQEGSSYYTSARSEHSLRSFDIPPQDAIEKTQHWIAKQLNSSGLKHADVSSSRPESIDMEVFHGKKEVSEKDSNSSITHVPVHTQNNSNQHLDPELLFQEYYNDPVVKDLLGYTLDDSVTKLLIRNVPTVPGIEYEIKDNLLSFVNQVFMIESYDGIITAVVSREGVHDFFHEYHDKPYGNVSGNRLIVLIIP